MFKPSLVHLETLVWIARLGSFAAAATRLNTTQPTVSARVKELEDRLGIRVFERMGRRMILTVKGRTLVDRYAPLLDEMDGVLRAVTNARDMRGTLKLGCGEIFAVTGLAAITRLAREKMPDVDWEIDVDLTVNLRHKLSRAALDLAIIVTQPGDSEVDSACLSKINLAWCCHAELARQHGLTRRGADMAALPIWTLSKPSLQYHLTMDCLRGASRGYRINTCNHVQALIRVIASGSGVAMLPDVLLQEGSLRRQLVRVFPERAAIPIEFRVAHRGDTNDSLILTAYELIQQHASARA
ncbi:LysR family transcriptional regulator [Orrella sp. JC864]|uniref:LysR family transcriptional regulator n=1 Tax=Orrella sp. JC864 TaxID=3120298 RepID=UPI00300B70AC